MRWRYLSLLPMLLLSLAPSDARADVAQGAAAPRLRSFATGFFVDDVGHLLTARHAVDACSGVYLLRPGRVAPLTIVAKDDATDLALLRAPETLGQASAFAREAPPPDGGAVFTASYLALLGREIDGVLVNGIVPPRRGTTGNPTFPISSAAGAGSSGAPVIDGRGLVIGVVFARQQPAGAGRRLGIAAPLLAVDARHAKAFLVENGVMPREGDAEPRQDRAARADAARAYTVGIGCGG